MVPNRACDGCVVCCIVPPIKSAEFSKPSGTKCVHCVPGGCGIHATIPKVCGEWFCGWRSLPFLDDRWKPDRCGLLVVAEERGVPASFARRVGLNFVAHRSRKDLEQPFVIEMIAGLAHDGVPLFLSVPGPPGFHFASLLLNPLLQDAARMRDGHAIRKALLGLYDVLAKGPFEPAEAGPSSP